MDYFALGWAVLVNAGMGAGWALFGWKRLGESGETLDKRKLLRAILIGAVLGGLAGFWGVSYDVAAGRVEGAGAMLGMTILADLVAGWLLSRKG